MEEYFPNKIMSVPPGPAPEPEIDIQRNPRDFGYAVYLIARTMDGRRYLAPPPEVELVEPGAMVRPTVCLSDEKTQKLFDALWKQGSARRTHWARR